MKKMTGKVSNIIITFFIAAIIISFALTGFEGFNNTSGAVGKVDGNLITTSEYKNALNQQIQRYSSMLGSDLTSAQIKQFRIRENTINELVTRKVMINYARKLGFKSSKNELKDVIRDLPYFQTAGKFDVSKYRSLLRANQLNPNQFEDTFRDDVKLQKISPLFENINISNSLARDIITFKHGGPKAIAVKFEKEKNTQMINIPKSEIQDFLKKEDSLQVLKSVYNSMQDEFNRPEEVKASHILLRTNPDGSDEKEVLAKANQIRKTLNRVNFARIANEKTDDPSGKGKGGDLGFFSKGRMVPEFDETVFNMKVGEISQPIKTQFGYHIIYKTDLRKAINKELESVKELVAKRHLQKIKRNELKELNEKLKNEISELIQKENLSALRKLAKKYDFTLIENQPINFFDSLVGEISFDIENLSPILKNHDHQEVIVQDDVVEVKILAVTGATKKVKTLDDEEAFNKEKNSLREEMQNNLQSKLIENLRNDSKIITYSNML